MKRSRNDGSISGYRLAGMSLNAFGKLPLRVIGLYYMGSIPFVLGFLHFWADMSRNGYADRRCFPAAMGLTFLFIWMKCWQSAFLAEARHVLLQVAPVPWNSQRVMRLVSQQSLQGFGILAIPVSMVLALPFYAVHNFYQNLSVEGSGELASRREVLRRAWRKATPHSYQSHVFIWLLSPWLLILGAVIIVFFSSMLTRYMPATVLPSEMITLVTTLFIMATLLIYLAPFVTTVFVNVAIILGVLPHLATSLFGVQTAFTVAGTFAILNTTFMMTALFLTYLCVDPLIKVGTLLRCFFIDARTDGADLLFELADLPDQPGTPPAASRPRRSAAPLIPLLILLASITTSQAQIFPTPPIIQPSNHPLPSPSPQQPTTSNQQLPSTSPSPSPSHEQLATSNQQLPSTSPSPSPSHEQLPTTNQQLPSTSPSPPRSSDVEALNRSINRRLDDPAYAWRMPRERRPGIDLEADMSWLEAAFRPIEESIQSFVRRFGDSIDGLFERLEEWLRDLTPSWEGGDPVIAWSAWLRLFLFLLLALVISLLVIIILRYLRNRQPAKATAAVTIVTAPDLSQEHVAADRLPPNEWLDLAAEQAARGELRLALRALFLASLSDLGQRGLLALALSKSNREYRRELERRSHDRRELVAAFTENVRTLEAVWYGNHAVTAALYAHFESNQGRIVDAATS